MRFRRLGAVRLVHDRGNAGGWHEALSQRYNNAITLIAIACLEILPGPDDHPAETDDPLLTVAEIAAELRLNPATIRLWISKGALPATRAGRRKLLVRRSDLDRMLELTQRTDRGRPTLPRAEGGFFRRSALPTSEEQLSNKDIHLEGARQGEMEEILNGIRQADEEWRAAQAASESPPPDPGFANRVRDLAFACDHQGTYLSRAARILGFRWTPLPRRRGMTISYELRPGANRPGPAELWLEFDRAVEQLGVAMEGAVMYNVAFAYRRLADVMHAIADDLLGGPPSLRERSS
jgi:excisionase family DNA binding protein